MNQLSKILVTTGVVFIFLFIFGALVGGGGRPGILGLILFAALIGALKAIWKKPKNKDNNDNNDNSPILQ